MRKSHLVFVVVNSHLDGQMRTSLPGPSRLSIYLTSRHVQSREEPGDEVKQIDDLLSLEFLTANFDFLAFSHSVIFSLRVIAPFP